MVADVPLSSIIQTLEHDGSEIIFPDLDEPIRRRAFCIEEIQYITPLFGFVLVPYSGGISYCPTVNHRKDLIFCDKFNAILEERDGLLFGKPKGKSLHHVVAWSAKDGLIYDPNGTKYSIAGCFEIETFYGAYRC
jgi:hypothetical protein